MVLTAPGSLSTASNAAPGAPYFVPFGPPHPVTISRCSWIGATEVRKAQYSALMGANPSFFTAATHPVEQVSWSDAQAYCAALAAQQSALGQAPACYQYRLPTEAEWDCCCRAGTDSEFSFGAELHCADARINDSQHSGTWCASLDETA